MSNELMECAMEANRSEKWATSKVSHNEEHFLQILHFLRNKNLLLSFQETTQRSDIIDFLSFRMRKFIKVFFFCW